LREVFVISYRKHKPLVAFLLMSTN